MRRVPRISVIIPAFNAARFLRETLDSALSQTLPAAEIIVVDDGSNDDTVDIARQYGARVTVLQRSQGGASAARNHGASRATGDWLAFLDADDIWLSEKLEHQSRFMDDGCALVYCDRFNIGVLDGLPEVHSRLQPLFEGRVFLNLLLTGNVITTSGVLIRREVFRALGGFDEDPGLLPAEDWDLWLRVAAVHEIRACREPLIQYRLHIAGVSRGLGRMTAARCLVTSRALASPAGRRLNVLARRMAWSETWRANGADAVRAGATSNAVAAYLRSAWYWPIRTGLYVDMVRALVGRR